MAVVTDTSSPFTKEVVESFWVLDNLLLRLLKDIKDFITTSLLSHPHHYSGHYFVEPTSALAEVPNTVQSRFKKDFGSGQKVS